MIKKQKPPSTDPSSSNTNQNDTDSNDINSNSSNIESTSKPTTVQSSHSQSPSDLSHKGEQLQQNLKNYVFPKNKDGRSFQLKWINLFNWIEYSKEKNAVFCYPCRHFGNNSSSDVFTSAGFSKWTKALANDGGFKKHETCNTHLQSMLSWKEYMKRIETNQEISFLVNDTTLEKRQYYMREIISTIYFLVQNELAFRGNWIEEEHEESGIITFSNS